MVEGRMERAKKESPELGRGERGFEERDSEGKESNVDKLGGGG